MIEVFKQLHMPLALHFIVEIKPEAVGVEKMQLSCLHQGDSTFVLAYLSRLDAELVCQQQALTGGLWRVLDFDDIDFSHYIHTHDGRLNLAIVYAFAACEHGIVHDDEGRLIEVMQFVHYQINTIAKEPDGTIVLPISEKLIHWLEVLFYRLGVDSVSVRFEWFESLGVDLRDRIVNEALSRIKGCPKCQISISACASFDTQIDDWVFVNYPIIEERVSLH